MVANQEILADARRLAHAGATKEMILIFLRDRGLDKIDSIKFLRALYGVSISDAKEVIDHSAAWSDRFGNDAAFREEAIRALKELAASDDKDLPRIEFTELDDSEK